MVSSVHPARVRVVNNKPARPSGACVVYWMQKDQRAHDNWAMVYAIEQANAYKVPLVVVFVLTDKLANNYERHYRFMLQGLAETAGNIRAMGAEFVMRMGYPPQIIADTALELDACEIVTDESYLRLGRSWRIEAGLRSDVLLTAICAHLIIPVDHIAEKQMVGAYVLRPRINKVLNEFLTDYPDIELLNKWKLPKPNSVGDHDPSRLMAMLKLRPDAELSVSLAVGSMAANAILDELIDGRLSTYNKRSDPNELSAQSGLSPYLHYGQISAQRIMYDLLSSQIAEISPEIVEQFAGELIVWRELANNFVYYNRDYRNLAGAPAWAQKQLALHADDPRDYIYNAQQFELAATHDLLWNAAQQELVKTGKMHNYMRMYWAKKVLEWSESPDEAVNICTYLNDKYELDGREPNGYAGILWAVAGLHDRPWFERPVYGQIRYMNANGAAKKFDVAAYIARMAAQ